MRTWAERLACIAVAISLSGCAALAPLPRNTQALVQHSPAVELSQVPFFPQDEYQCGPAALAMVLTNGGLTTTPQALKDRVYLPDRQGSLQTEMLAAARHSGFLAYPLRPNLKGVLDALQAGHPPVVLVNLSLPIYPQWHYAVVVGVKPQSLELILRSGTQARESMPVRTFLNLWERSQYWGFVVLPPDSPPPPYAQAQTWFEASMALERLHLDLAAKAYAAGTQRWPQNHLLWFGLGNASFGLNDMAKAAVAYREAVRLQNDFGDGWNNLAETQFALGERDKALSSVRTAMGLGGKNLTLYEQTFKRIQGP